jgi:hypothetical protein
VGSKPKIVAKSDPSVSNSAWESIFQMNVDFHLGARQAEGLQPWNRRAPQESDRFPTDFIPFPGRLCLRSVFFPLFFSLFLKK